MLVRIHPVQRILKGNIRHTGFNLRFHNSFQQLFSGYKFEHFQLAELGVQIQLIIQLFKFISPQVGYFLAVNAAHFRRIDQQPVFVALNLFHKQIGNNHLRKNVIGLHPLIAVLGTQLQKSSISRCHMSKDTVTAPLRLPC